MSELLSKDHSILEKGRMEYRPFGIDTNGQKIRDASGITVRANVEYLQETVERKKGADACSTSEARPLGIPAAMPRCSDSHSQ